VSGLGATWATDVSRATDFDVYVISATGVTGGGVVSINGFSAAGDFEVYVLRSDVPVTPHSTAAAQNGASSQIAGTIITLGTVSAPAGATVIAVGEVSGGTMAFPESTSTPATGWTTDRTGTNINGRFIHQDITADTSVQLKVTSDIAFHAIIAAVVYYDDTVPTPPPATGFSGWGTPI
jgi:hypothetical protein